MKGFRDFAKANGAVGKEGLKAIWYLFRELYRQIRQYIINIKKKKMKKLLLALAVALYAIPTTAQIGYKGQMSIEVAGEVSHIGAYGGSIKCGAYLSQHSVLALGVQYDQTKYEASDGDSFHVKDWLGSVNYNYAFPLNRFIIQPSGGIVLGGEDAGTLSQLGNLIPYKKQFVYGLQLGVEGEYILSQHWAVVVQPKMLYLLQTQFDSVRLGLAVGVKCYF